MIETHNSMVSTGGEIAGHIVTLTRKSEAKLEGRMYGWMD